MKLLLILFLANLSAHPTIEHISWQEVESSCEKIAQMVKDKADPIDMVIGVSRGGLVPSRIIADRLDIKELYIIKISFYTGINKREKEPKIVQKLPLSIEGKTILLVDDIVDTGKSLKVAIDYLNNMKPKKIYTAAMQIKNKSIVDADFFISKVDSWIVYPWEKNESQKEIAELFKKP